MEMEKCKNPIVSVIMSIYNQQNREQLETAIKSVLEQSFQDFEFIIYNESSKTIYVEALDLDAITKGKVKKSGYKKRRHKKSWCK